MNNPNELFVDHEVRIRLIEELSQNNKERFDKLDNKIDSHFKWVMGTLFGLFISIIGLFGSIILTKLI